MAGKVTRDLTAQVKVTKTGKKGVLKDVTKDLKNIETAGKKVGTGTQQGLKAAGAAAVATARKVDNLEKQMKQLKSETRKAKKELRDFKKAGAGVGGLTRSFQGLKGVIGALGFTAAFIGIKRGIDSVIEAAERQDQALAQIDAALESTESAAGLTAAELENIAVALQKVTNFGDEATLEMEAVLLTFTKIGGDVFPRVAAATLDVATRMKTDLKSAALQVGKALNDPIAGLGGLSRAGIQFSEDQKELIKTLVKMGETAKAQEIILKELETQFGGSAEAARKASSGFEALSNAFGDLLEKIGEGGLTAEIRNITAELTALAEDESAAQFAEGIGKAFSVITTQVKTMVGVLGILNELRIDKILLGKVDLDAITEKYVNFTEEFEERMLKLHEPVEEAADKIKPPLERINKGVNLMADGVLSANEVFLSGSGGMDEWGASAENASQRFVNAARDIKLSGEEIANAIGGADQEMKSFVPSGQTMEEALKGIQGGLDNTADQGFLKFQEEALAAGVSIEDFVKEGDTAAEKYAIWQAKLNKVAEAEEKIAVAAEKARSALDKVGESEIGEDLGVMITEAGTVVESLNEIGKIEFPTTMEAMLALRKEAQGLKEDLDAVTASANALDSAGSGGTGGAQGGT